MSAPLLRDAQAFNRILLLSFLNLLHLHGANLKRQSEQIDESVGIVMVVKLSCREACKGFAV